MGYDIERFVGQVNEGLLCCICRDVLEDPLQAPCEHAFCSSCIQGWLVHENICPEDRRTLLITQLRPLFRYMKNDLNKLEVCCSNADNGCTFITTLENIDRHENECDFGRVSCPSNGCGAVMERRNLNSHLATCEFRTKVCPKGCGLTILSKEDEDHNCIGELRTELELLRSEMICKLEDQRKEMQLRLDSQRSHMVQKTSQMQQQIDELRGQLSRLQQDVRTLLAAERKRRQEMERMELEKQELLDILRSLQREADDNKKSSSSCRNCKRGEKITAI